MDIQRRRLLATALAVAYLVFLLLGAISLLAHFFVGVVLWVALGVALLVLTYVIVRRPRPSNCPTTDARVQLWRPDGSANRLDCSRGSVPYRCQRGAAISNEATPCRGSARAVAERGPNCLLGLAVWAR